MSRKDDLEKLERYLDAVETDIGEGLATIEKAEVRFYRGSR